MLERIFQLRIFRAMRTALAALAILVLTVNGAFGMGPIVDEALADVGPSRGLWAAAYARSALATDVLRRHRSGLAFEAADGRPQVLTDPPNGGRTATAPGGESDPVPSAGPPRTWPRRSAAPAGFGPLRVVVGPHPPGPLGSRAPPLIA